MLKTNLNFALSFTLLLASATPVLGQNPTPLLTQPADKLIAVLQSSASQKEKADACRELAVIGTQEAISTLVGLLADEKLSHMARYGLETIPEPAVDTALREALGKLTGRPLVGVIGSVGVRRDALAIPALAKLLPDGNPDVAQAAARALGTIGTAAAAKPLQDALAGATVENQLAFCEGLFRCAEALVAKGQTDPALAIYDRLRAVEGHHQVRAGALRGAIRTRGQAGLPLLRQALQGNDFVLVGAAVRVAIEMKEPEVTQALTSDLGSLSADKQIVVIQALGKRADAAALPALFTLAKSGAKPVRIEAVRALPQIGHASAVPELVGLLRDGDRELAQAAQEALASLPGPEAEAAVVTLLGSSEASQRLTGIELVGRRRMTGCIPALLKSAADPEATVRPVALKRLGELAGAGEMGALLDLLARTSAAADLDATEQALGAVCARAESPEGCVEKLTGRLGAAQPAQKSVLLRVLTSIGGENALKAIRAAIEDPNAEVHAAAIRSLSAWKTADAAPALLTLAQSAGDPTDKMLCLRGYLGWAAHPDVSADKRLAMCQQAASLIQRTEEKKLLLGALGGITTIESLALIAPHLDAAATKEEAATAAVVIAEKLLKGANKSEVAPKLIEPMQKVAQVTGNDGLAKRAKAVCEQAQGAK